MNIYKHELKENFRSTIIWIFTLSGIVAVFMSFYPLFKNGMDDFIKLLNNFPPAVKAIMGIEVNNFSSVIGFYGFIFTYITLFGSIQALSLGVGIISKEQTGRTADFILTKPVSRYKIFSYKLLSVVTLIIITNIIYFAVSFICLNLMSDENLNIVKFILINSTLFFIQVIFFSIGLIVSFAFKKIKSVISISLGLVFMFFGISAFVITADNHTLRYLTPFQYFKTDSIISQGKYEFQFLYIGIFIIAISVLMSYYLFKHKDINAV